MGKNLVTVSIVGMLIAAMAGPASAEMFEQKIGVDVRFGLNWKTFPLPVTRNHVVWHDVGLAAPSMNLAVGDVINNATLELVFAGAANGSVQLRLDDSLYGPGGLHQAAGLNGRNIDVLARLGDDGKLKVEVKRLGLGFVPVTWVSSTLRSDLTPIPTPTPGAVLLGLLGFGLAGIKLRRFV